MKKYLKTLLPYRWIWISVFILLWLPFVLYLGPSLDPDYGTFISFVISIVYTILIDLTKGIARKSPLFEKLLK